MGMLAPKPCNGYVNLGQRVLALLRTGALVTPLPLVHNLLLSADTVALLVAGFYLLLFWGVVLSRFFFQGAGAHSLVPGGRQALPRSHFSKFSQWYHYMLVGQSLNQTERYSQTSSEMVLLCIREGS